jgi:broad specificity phosphatase PhoE
MKLYCLRHGETNYNRLGLCNDDPARDVYLTETGIRQAEAVAEELRDLPLERIFISELPRTRQTADIINRYHDVPVVAHPSLNDIRSGFDGRPVTEYFAATGHDRLHARANGGESLLDYRLRVLDFIGWLREQPDNCVLIVAHEETLRVFRAYLEGLADEEMLNLEFANCAVCAFEFT